MTTGRADIAGVAVVAAIGGATTGGIGTGVSAGLGAGFAGTRVDFNCQSEGRMRSMYGSSGSTSKIAWPAPSAMPIKPTATSFIRSDAFLRAADIVVRASIAGGGGGAGGTGYGASCLVIASGEERA